MDPVSYTHLDVYKRQDYDYGNDDSGDYDGSDDGGSDDGGDGCLDNGLLH